MRTLFCHCALALFTVIAASSCRKEKVPVDHPAEPAVPPVLLKEVTIRNLPAPYYYFEYNPAGLPIYVSVGSGLNMYHLSYNGSRLSSMNNDVIVNKDRLLYSYNSAGRVDTIRYVDAAGVVFKRVLLTYGGKQLIKAVRERKIGNDFMPERTMAFSYYQHGNLKELTEQRHAVSGEVEYSFTDNYEVYDNKLNADGFSLLHNDFFDHLFLLPGVQLMMNNPGRVTRTGNGLNYSVDYNYTYNDKNLPLTKTGEGVFTSGSAAGQRFQTHAAFAYY